MSRSEESRMDVGNWEEYIPSSGDGHNAPSFETKDPSTQLGSLESKKISKKKKRNKSIIEDDKKVELSGDSVTTPDIQSPIYQEDNEILSECNPIDVKSLTLDAPHSQKSIGNEGDKQPFYFPDRIDEIEGDYDFLDWDKEIHNQPNQSVSFWSHRSFPTSLTNPIDGEDEGNKIIFSSDKKEISVTTSKGKMIISLEEFFLYQNIFRCIDTESSGRLTSNSLLRFVLDRCGLSRQQLSFINNSVNVIASDVKGISFIQWLVLCRLIAYAQVHKSSAEMEEDFMWKAIACGDIQADFGIGKSLIGDTKIKQLETYRLVGFRVYPENLRSVCKYIIQKSPLSAAMPGSPAQDGNLRVTRRFSDFEYISNVLNRLYHGVVVPPLPPKSWTIMKNVETEANERIDFLKRFIRDLGSHPVLGNTFEVKIFLEGSSVGFEAFQELYNKMIDKFERQNWSDGKSPFSSSNSSIIDQAAKVSTALHSSLTTVAGLMNNVVGMFSFGTAAGSPPVSSTMASFLSASSSSGSSSTSSSSSSSSLSSRTLSSDNKSIDSPMSPDGTLTFDGTVDSSERAFSVIDSCAKLIDSIFKCDSDITNSRTLSFGHLRTAIHLNQDKLGVLANKIQLRMDKIERKENENVDRIKKQVLDPLSYLGSYVNSVISAKACYRKIRDAKENIAAKKLAMEISLRDPSTSASTNQKSKMEVDMENIRIEEQLVKEDHEKIVKYLSGDLDALKSVRVEMSYSIFTDFVDFRVNSHRNIRMELEKLRSEMADFDLEKGGSYDDGSIDGVVEDLNG